MAKVASHGKSGTQRTNGMPNPAEAYQHLAIVFMQYQFWLFIGTMAILGAAFISISIYAALPLVDVLHDVVRDIGIAILVACIIAALYETHARLKFEVKLMNYFLDVVVSDWSRPDVWKTVKSQIIEKTAIREKLRMAIRLQRDDKIGDDRMLLKLNVQYELHGLRSNPTIVSVEHFLDSHLKIEACNLPRFDYIQIGAENIPINEKTVNDNFEFSHKVEVPAQGDGGVSVITMRQETVYIPGNHCFAMNEITRGIELCLEELPRDLSAFVIIRPHSHVTGVELRPDSPNHFKDDDQVLLPGQIIELVFQRKASISTKRRRTDSFQRDTEATK